MVHNKSERKMEVMDRQKVKISVRNLVEFILRSGDIDNRIATQDKDAMQMGASFTARFRNGWGPLIIRRLHAGGGI